MWIITNRGFLSAVQHRDHDNILIVRARVRDHLRDAFPGRRIIETPTADYPYRIMMSREEFAAYLGAQVGRIDYDNFKNSMWDERLHDFATKVWEAGARILQNKWGQKKEAVPVPPKKKRGRPKKIEDREPRAERWEVCPICNTQVTPGHAGEDCSFINCPYQRHPAEE